MQVFWPHSKTSKKAFKKDCKTSLWLLFFPWVWNELEHGPNMDYNQRSQFCLLLGKIKYRQNPQLLLDNCRFGNSTSAKIGDGANGATLEKSRQVFYPLEFGRWLMLIRMKDYSTRLFDDTAKLQGEETHHVLLLSSSVLRHLFAQPAHCSKNLTVSNLMQITITWQR